VSCYGEHVVTVRGFKPIVVKQFVKIGRRDLRARSKTYLEMAGTFRERIGELLGTQIESVPANTDRHDFLHAIVNRGRVLSRLHVDQEALAGYGKELRHLFGRYSAHKWNFRSYDSIVASFSGPKRKLYQNAYDVYQRSGLGEMSFIGFVKSGEGQKDPENPRPRHILMQVSAYKNDPYYKGRPTNAPVLMELVGRRAQQDVMHLVMESNGQPLFAQGARPNERAEVIDYYMSNGYVGKSIDCKAFDGSQVYTAPMERQVYLETIRRLGCYNYKEQAEVLRAQNEGRVRFEQDSYGYGPARQSGTGGTSAGNKTVMVAALEYAFQRRELGHKVFFYCDGDDTLLFASEDEWERMGNGWMERMGRLGHETLIEHEFRTTGEAVFCRSKPMRVNDVLTIVKDVPAALKKALAITRHFKGHQFEDYCQTVSVGYGMLWAGVPILCKIGKLYDVGGRVNAELLGNSGLEYHMRSSVLEVLRTEVTDEARWDTERYQGISVATQLEIEEILESVAQDVHRQLSDRAWLAVYRS